MTTPTDFLDLPPSGRPPAGFAPPVTLCAPDGDTLLAIQTRCDHETVHLQARGELCLHTAPLLRTQLELVADGEHDIAVDLSDVTLLAAAGAHVLALADRRCQAAGRHLDIVGTPPATVQMVLEIAGLVPVIPHGASVGGRR